MFPFGKNMNSSIRRQCTRTHVDALHPRRRDRHRLRERHGHGGKAAAAVVSWLDWQLRGDATAAKTFKGKDCGLCGDPAWQLHSEVTWYSRSRYSNQSKSAGCAVPDMSWQATPTKAPVKFGAPGAVASSDRMLASNSSGSQFQASAADAVRKAQALVIHLDAQLDAARRNRHRRRERIGLRRVRRARHHAQMPAVLLVVRHV